MKLTNRRIRQIYAALTALSTRTLPTISSDLKVAALVRRFRGAVEDTEAVIRKIKEAMPAPEGLEGKELPVALLEERQRQIEAMLDCEVELPELPDDKRVIDTDLPKALKTGAGEENRVGLADILANLDLVYAGNQATQDPQED